jgi:nitrate/TMAO reductase-like tetraheme cytochrome c subunit
VLSDRASLRHPVTLAGVVITTVSAVAFLTLVAADMLGMFTSPYAGLVIFIAVPALFVFGLLFIPLGVWLHRRALRKNPSASVDWPVIDLRVSRVRAIVIAGIVLTIVNATLILLAAQGSLHYMESAEFCGQTCHTPMHPQYTAWQNTTHAKVACEQCHIGGGAQALVHYKLAGVRQLVHVVTGNYPRPIPASQAVLRPALETCGTCHSPTLWHGERTRTIREYAEDETNTATATTLTLHVGGPGQKTASGRAIHWHADPNVRIEYIATDADRQTIPFVRTINETGETTEYVVAGTTPETLAAGTTRTMDCIDCHNAAAHRISPSAEQAVNRALADGRLNPALPFVRREAVRLLKSDYNDEAAASAAIESGLRAVYAASKASADQAAVSQAITATQQLYRANVFPAMKVTWGVYRDNLGHTTSDGCFRCHDGQHVTRAGKAIEADCSYCHDQQ